ncbi:MAG: hypothetical protein KDA38_08240 [Planctomycetales bacterium]|nr:hypothetical protein [Planctomycetales bacterium]
MLESMRRPIRVIKVGGSLFDLPDLRQRVAEWRSRQRTALDVLVAGGGSAADVVRQWQARFALSDEASHWLCVDAMSVTARLLAELLEPSVLVTEAADLQARLSGDRVDSSPPVVFDAAQFLRAVEPTLAGERLPHSFEATSDSIAARVAGWLEADELVLLKSTLLDCPRNAVAGAEFGLVDRHFPRQIRLPCRVRLVDIRKESVPEMSWTG